MIRSPTTSGASIRSADSADVPAIAAIFNHAIEHTTASFWTEPRPEHEIADAMADAGDRYPWLVAEAKAVADNAIAGFAWSKPWSPRCGYASAVEVSVYVAEAHRGRGVGGELYRALLEALRKRGFRSAIAAIALPNEASVRLHERRGFRHAGTLEAVGEKFGRVLDVGYWQVRLNQEERPPWRP